MKKLLPLILFILAVNTAFSDYSTPGTGRSWTFDSLVANSGGNVTFSAGSYMVNDTIYISSSDTLKVLTNALIKFGTGVMMDINGVFIVNPPDSAKITAQDTTTKFLGLRIDSSNATSIRKLIFEYGNAIRILDCNILIDSCVIRYNTLNSSFSSSAISVFRSNSTISNCKIYRNRRSAIAGGGNIANSPAIINNQIYENNTENANVPQINIGATHPTVPLIIRGNTIRGFFDNAGGIAIFPVGSAPNVIIENNIIKKNRYGMVLQGANIVAYVNNNIIDSNNIQGLPLLGGSGINIVGNQTSIFTRNVIRGNLWGVTVQSNGQPNFGDLGNADTTDIGLNQIYNNSHNDTTFDFYNNTANPIKAENNYWGTTIVDTVEAHIFHQPDNGSLGPIDFLPIRVVTDITGTGSVPSEYKLFDAYPNPFNPATTIKFSMPEASDAKIVIYDNLGREAAVLLNSRLNAGTYEMRWNASSFASGIYYYRFITPGFSAVKKLMLVK
jgi:hypothetical protein